MKSSKMIEIIDLQEEERGCGFWKKGGLYLTLLSGNGTADCGRLPVPFTKCPCCGGGITRTAWPQMIQARLLLEKECEREPCNRFCFLSRVKPEEDMLLLWVGEKYYPTTEAFVKEAKRMGVSRRITQVPKGFELGKSWVVLAHANAITEVTDDGEVITTPGAFYLFKPDNLQYVVRGDETEEELERFAARGFTLVRVTEKRMQNGVFDFDDEFDDDHGDD